MGMGRLDCFTTSLMLCIDTTRFRGGLGKPSKMGTSAKLFCNLLLGWLIKGVVRIGGMLVGSGGQITSSSSPDS